ncbi:MAG: N-acetylmuramic acid 6-phosphate etherase [candidate division KSB1 bacterium]|nr:N-acetylmuramic acid 6-phosphate etherase [candidate division KSB1 bacterium]MDZ7392351.1 N-acetylmuramic acid 6-phosphate etherase [candidate division KSB1 bacterium]
MRRRPDDNVFAEIQNLITEARNPATMDIDSKSVEEILRLINAEDKKVPLAVEKEIPYIAQAVEIVVQAFRAGGRLFYIGAGTSGRLGVLDASEIPPTFGAPPEMVQGIIAGGYKALVRAQEGAEDRRERGGEDLVRRGFTPKDVACGIAASRRTPYVLGAIEKAREIGGKTLYVTCTPREELNFPVDVAICPVVGPEVVMGSTRMKAGTATKLVLNMITTTAMIRLGKVYGNMMVDLQMTSRKLEERSKRTVMIVTGVSYEEAEAVLEKAGGHVKTALVMILAGVDAEEARRRLQRAGGFVRQALEKD